MAVVIIKLNCISLWHDIPKESCVYIFLRAFIGNFGQLMGAYCLSMVPFSTKKVIE